MSVSKRVIRPHARDQQLSPIPVDFDPDTLGWILDEGGEKMTWEELQAVKNHQDCHFDYET
jgi:hypothetical protein